MHRRSLLCLCGVAVAGLSAETVLADDRALSAADRAFVAKVSQGGMYEVQASKLVAGKAHAQNVIDTGVTEVHDHQLVGARLASIAGALGLPFPTSLNPMFQQRLDRLDALSGPAFDHAYIEEMDQIHAVDVLAFAQQARAGQNPALRAFASETVLIVRRHIGALHAIPVPA